MLFLFSLTIIARRKSDERCVSMREFFSKFIFGGQHEYEFAMLTVGLSSSAFPMSLKTLTHIYIWPMSLYLNAQVLNQSEQNILI